MQVLISHRVVATEPRRRCKALRLVHGASSLGALAGLLMCKLGHNSVVIATDCWSNFIFLKYFAYLWSFAATVSTLVAAFDHLARRVTAVPSPQTSIRPPFLLFILRRACTIRSGCEGHFRTLRLYLSLPLSFLPCYISLC